MCHYGQHFFFPCWDSLAKFLAQAGLEPRSYWSQPLKYLQLQVKATNSPGFFDSSQMGHFLSALALLSSFGRNHNDLSLLLIYEPVLPMLSPCQGQDSTEVTVPTPQCHFLRCPHFIVFHLTVQLEHFLVVGLLQVLLKRFWTFFASWNVWSPKYHIHSGPERGSKILLSDSNMPGTFLKLHYLLPSATTGSKCYYDC
jgi:hypothetical protein